MQDALRAYLAAASGLTEMTRQRALSTARALVAQGEATAPQVGGLTEELLAQSRHNRDHITMLVKTEVTRALRRGGPSTDGLDELRERVRRLEEQIDGQESRRSDVLPVTKSTVTKSTATKRTASKPAGSPPAGSASARSPGSATRAGRMTGAPTADPPAHSTRSPRTPLTASAAQQRQKAVKAPKTPRTSARAPKAVPTPASVTAAPRASARPSTAPSKAAKTPGASRKSAKAATGSKSAKAAAAPKSGGAAGPGKSGGAAAPGRSAPGGARTGRGGKVKPEAAVKPRATR